MITTVSVLAVTMTSATDVAVTLVLMSMTLGHLVSGTKLGEGCQSSYECSKTAVNSECGQFGNRGMCRCRHGYVQNTTVEYVKQECVLPPPPPTKTFGQPCSWSECVDPLVCKHGTCKCPAFRLQYISETQDCDDSDFKGPCFIAYLHEDESKAENFEFIVPDGGCKYSSDLWCVKEECFCPPPGRKHNWNEASKRCEGNYAGQDCEEEEDCHEYGGLKCTAAGKCACDPSWPNWHAGERQCYGAYHGQPCKIKPRPIGIEVLGGCTWKLRCVNNLCACDPSFPRLDAAGELCMAKFRYGESCDTDECEHEDLSCLNKICSCKNASQEFFDWKECRTKAKRWLGAPCKSDGDCNTERGFVCRLTNRILAPPALQCSCEEGFRISPDHRFCLTYKYCKEEDGGKWCNATQRLECGTRDHCSCAEGTEFSQVSKKCGLIGGADCRRDNGDPGDDLCASGTCVTNVTTVPELIGKCSCSPINGFDRVWSLVPGEGCVLDLHRRHCYPEQKGDDCRAGVFSNVPERLRCLEASDGWRCECAQKDAVYLRGYCVVADRGHGDNCDPINGPTCKTDPTLGLVCTFEPKPYYRHFCLCQPRVVTSGDNVSPPGTVPWDSAMGQCQVTEDLKGPGQGCDDHGECQSGVCAGAGHKKCSDVTTPCADEDTPCGEDAQTERTTGGGAEFKVTKLIITLTLTIQFQFKAL